MWVVACSSDIARFICSTHPLLVFHLLIGASKVYSIVLKSSLHLMDQDMHLLIKTRRTHPSFMYSAATTTIVAWLAFCC
jgi:hypothetical protein